MTSYGRGYEGRGPPPVSRRQLPRHGRHRGQRRRVPGARSRSRSARLTAQALGHPRHVRRRPPAAGNNSRKPGWDRATRVAGDSGSGWGELYLSTSAPSAGRSWSGSETRRKPCQLSTGPSTKCGRALRAGVDCAAAQARRRARHDPRWTAVPWRAIRAAPREPVRPDLRSHAGGWPRRTSKPPPPRSPVARTHPELGVTTGRPVSWQRPAPTVGAVMAVERLLLFHLCAATLTVHVSLRRCGVGSAR